MSTRRLLPLAVVASLLAGGLALAPATAAQAVSLPPGGFYWCVGDYPNNKTWRVTCSGGSTGDRYRAKALCIRAGHTNVTRYGSWIYGPVSLTGGPFSTASCPLGYEVTNGSIQH